MAFQTPRFLKMLSFASISALAAMLICSCGEKTDASPASPAKPATTPEVNDTDSPAPAPEEKEETKPAENADAKKSDKKSADTKETQLATFGGGCFWCTEAVMERLEGVVDVKSGYMGGHVENPTYEQVCQKDTGHVEVIQVAYNPKEISFDELLNVFWQAHDPTSWDQQGNDKGPQYRSAIFAHSAEQKAEAEKSKKLLAESGTLSGPVVTEIRDAEKFWEAEGYHQDFYKNNPTHGYCRVVISPKLKKLGIE